MAIVLLSYALFPPDFRTRIVLLNILWKDRKNLDTVESGKEDKKKFDVFVFVV